MTAESPILPDEEVRRLWAEYDRLSAQKAEIDARLAKINEAIVASGEAKVRAIREHVADLERLT